MLEIGLRHSLLYLLCSSIRSSGGDAVKTISIAFSLSKEFAFEKFEPSSFLENNRLLQVSSTCQISVLKSSYLNHLIFDLVQTFAEKAKILSLFLDKIFD